MLKLIVVISAKFRCSTCAELNSQSNYIWNSATFKSSEVQRRLNQWNSTDLNQMRLLNWQTFDFSVLFYTSNFDTASMLFIHFLYFYFFLFRHTNKKFIHSFISHMPNECINYFNWPICLHDSESKMAVGKTRQLSVLYYVRHSLSFTVSSHLSTNGENFLNEPSFFCGKTRLHVGSLCPPYWILPDEPQRRHWHRFETCAELFDTIKI